MFATRRLAKRSIVGTRVAAKWQDGRFYTGVIQSEYAEQTPFTDAVYTVLFEDGYKKHIPFKSIIGPGFQTTASSILKTGQKVYVTLNGREVTGLVINHKTYNDEVLIQTQNRNGEDVEISKRIEEVRLMKSRKSARLMEQDTGYSNLAAVHLCESKKRTVSSGIDVPSKQQQYGQSEIDMQRCDDQESNSHYTVTDAEVGNNTEIMDETIAALVLTSLSCSPQSPPYHQRHEYLFLKNCQPSTSASSSGFCSNQSEPSDPSPPDTSHLSESVSMGSGMIFGPFQVDDGVEVDELNTDNPSSPAKKMTMYQCTWPGCKKISAMCNAIEKHVRDLHLGIPMNHNSGSDSCGEEDFYYTEIEVNVENVTLGFSDMCSSQPSPSFEITEHGSPASLLKTDEYHFAIPDHDYQKKEFHQGIASCSVPSTSTIFSHSGTMPIPIKMMEFQQSLSWQRSHSWQNTHTYATSPSPPIRIHTKPSMQERLLQHQAQSPKIHTSSQSKTMSIHKKQRGDVRKCRKVYGMENRDMWCTQCKWKKACTRFLE